MADGGLDDLIKDIDELLAQPAASGPAQTAGRDSPSPDDLTVAARASAARDVRAAAEASETGSDEAPSRSRDPATPRSLLDDSDRGRWQSLFETSALLNSTRFDLDLILETVVDVAVRLTRARRGILFLADEVGQLARSVGRDANRQPLQGAGLDVPRTVIDRVIETRDPLFIPRFTESPLRRSESVASLGLHSCMCVPLTVTVPEDRPPTREERRRYAAPAPLDLLGVLYVDSDSAQTVFGEPDLMFFLALAHHATTAILNARLYQQAITDPLTRLFSRRHFHKALEESEKRHGRDGSPVSLLMIDVDYFKRVNDRFGHVAGDGVLRQFADILRSTLRADDEAFRYGGEEFSVLLSDTDSKGALVLAEKLRRRIESAAFTERQIRVTVSVGVGSLPKHARNVTELVKRSDQALYQAKEGGRNRCRVWSEDLGARARRQDPLAGIFTGVFATDYDNVRLLLETFNGINSTLDINELLSLAIDKVLEATDAARGALLLREGDELRRVVARGRDGSSLPPTERFSKSIPEKVMATGESCCLIEGNENDMPLEPDATGSGKFRSASIVEMELRTVMCVPLETRKETLGVLYVDSRAVGDRLRESSLPFFEALGRTLALAIENARLRAQLALDQGDEAPAAGE